MAVFYFSRTYDEAFELLLEARGFAENEIRQRPADNLRNRLSHNRESLRLTSRLAQIVAWLLAQKAYHAGELTDEELRQDAYRLSGQEVCLKVAPMDETTLSPKFENLLKRSYGLYCRVQRLDRQLDQY